MLLQCHEQLEQRRRVALEDIVGGGLQEAVAHLKVFVDGFGGGAGAGQYRFLELLQEHFAEPAEVHHGAVIALHELLDGEHIGGILVAKQLGDARLMVEQ